VEEIDWSVGEVLSALRRLGAENNTLVMFSSDNGPWYQGSPGRLRGRKGSTYEGGVREPFLARLPGRIPKGRVSNGVAGTIDILPTLASLTGTAPPKRPLDGIDITPLLTGQAASLEREALLYFDDWNLQCARWKNWKLHFARYNNMAYNPAPQGGRVNLPLKNPELYDIERDPDESYDAAAGNPQVVAEIQSRVERLLESFPAEVRQAWAKTRAEAVAATPAGALPRRAN
jgi:arylsulfatase